MRNVVITETCESCKFSDSTPGRDKLDCKLLPRPELKFKIDWCGQWEQGIVMEAVDEEADNGTV